jgi:uncharacterized metal-binding protein YceD (DUF177 family)
MTGTVLHHDISIAEPPSHPVKIAASEAQRIALAEAYDLLSVRSLDATLEVIPVSGGLSVEGHVVADVVQTCVVSLVPVDEHIDETFSVRFVDDPARLNKPDTEVVVDANMDDPPELLIGPTLDLGALAEEYFALAINPYPRAPGAELPPEADDAGGRSDSPFALLASLAKSPGPKQ